ncbi:sigma-54 dependent transcriptional regulator [Marinobacterium weihaiense]|uniref:Sigma-54 dependent transcriptional regulator n=1 Tax=Marinobacterium weihaiense TaxID=2851016 RepID=A0ABS6ME43_9GAMM|nr:sigma-54 dependent transcriptional regulator [Marinobacterium weihaiense]MBV0934591.1 sigma-54 dependent transcriptional regulator [Marinobacterium weihaiense]
MKTSDTQEHTYPETERPLLLLQLSAQPSHELTLVNLKGWRLITVTSLEEADRQLQAEHFVVGLACFDWHDDSQQQALTHFFQHHHQTAWVAAIRPEQLQSVSLRRLLFENFYDYCSLPLGDNLDHLAIILGHAYGLYHLQHQANRHLESEHQFEMVGASPKMLEIFDLIRKVAQTDATVLIMGESGTGKELIARAIHQRSSRQNQPFVAVNCGALPETLIQSELFGYEKGAFTGASQRRLGRIEAAHQGSLFLDEVGDLAANLQGHLLRFLQEGTIERLGSNQSLAINTRVIAATNIDLEQAVEDGRFREDLYYRLSVLNIRVPPLRDRAEDKELLARFFFNKFASDHNGNLKGFTQEAIDAINTHNWPGNVREMINRIRRGMIMSDNRLITPQDLNLESPDGHQIGADNLKTLDEARAEAERVVIEHTLSQCKNNVSKAARILDVSRVTLYRMMEKHHLQHHKGAPHH